ncbi:MAG: imelysin family protein [Piscinibacter sp.]
MKRRTLLQRAAAALLPLALPAAARAQSNWRDVAVPSYLPPDFVAGALKFWFVPRAEEFAGRADALVAALAAGCGPAAQAAWREALLAWVRLSAVAAGPLLERRSVRRIDFQPTRPEAIERAVAAQPAGEAALERVGSAAKGFAALEWLLWSPKLTPEHCRYAGELAQDIAREAAALKAAFIAQRDLERDDEAVVAAMSEILNQWIGGIEQLRLQGIERPLHEARSRVRAKPPFPRALSGSSGAERSARAQALRALAVFDAKLAPAGGAGLVPLETYLRGKGLNPLADRLRAAAAQAGNGLGSDAVPALQAAARRLAGLKHLAESEVAPALDVRVGFSDADGD